MISARHEIILNMTVTTQFCASIATKAVIQANRGGTLALAIAMLEDGTLQCDYPFGDVYPNGILKTGDAANFGIYKMNWYMIQQCPSAKALFPNQPGSDSWKAAGTKINGDAGLATHILLEAMNKWSMNEPDPNAPVTGNFWAGHRWGESGLNNQMPTDWQDVLNYYLAVKAITDKCDSDSSVWTTNVRYGVNVPNVFY